VGEFRMPSLGADMEAGTLLLWKIAPGDRVKRGQIVGEVETQKGIIELEIWEDGVVESLTVGPGTKVPVGTVLARVVGAAPVATSSPVSVPAHAPPAAPVSQAAEPTLAHTTDLRVSPAARLRARELDVDLHAVTPTGPHGSITRDDVERAAGPRLAAPEPVPAPTSDAGARSAAMRRAIAAAMARSKREIPHYYLSTTIDMSRALALLEAKNAGRPPTDRILPAALMIQAVARALRDFPELNGFCVDGELQRSEAIHVGVAISLRQGGLVAPAILDTDRRSLEEVMAALRDLVGRARAGSLRASEMSSPTITVTNLGDQGVESVFGVIYPPQVALVGFGKVEPRPWARDGMLGVHPLVTATLAADHRVSDGHRGGVFLTAVAKKLNEELA
jgi:pyruvate dehydrogenase E2 component (dihydrolipoamide acetyltransferase)